MHSGIFQISPEPIDEEDYIKESYYYDHWFVGKIADYVAETDDRKKDIKYLKSCAKGFVVDRDKYGDYLMVTDKEEYFEVAFKTFRATLDKIRNCSIEDFSNGVPEMWTLEDSYEDKLSFYVFTDDGDTISLDDFVRRAALNKKFYIGAALDYHF